MFLEPQPTWKVIDATKLQTFLSCPRQFFYNYVLGWQQDIPNIHLAFGEAWHKAMETLLRRGYSPEAIVEAANDFQTAFSKEYPDGAPSTDGPKAVANIPLALMEYTLRYERDEFPGTAKVMHTEVAGTVPVNDERVLHFRLDALIRDEHDRVFVLEHKTASRFDRIWDDQWSLSMQISTYLHVLYCLYDQSEVYGVVVNGTAFQKSQRDFKRIPIRKQLQMLSAWLYEVNEWLDQLDFYMAELEKASPQDAVLQTFPKNPCSCTKYNGCPYLGLCNSWGNPLAYAKQPPPGFKVNHWNPADLESKPIRTLIDVAKGQVTDIGKEGTEHGTQP